VASISQSNVDASMVDEFNALVTAARNMVSRLSQGGNSPISATTSVPEVSAFQTAWNKSRDIVVTLLDNVLVASKTKYTPPAAVANTVKNGLGVDGKYGNNTALALAQTMWAQSMDVSAFNKIKVIVPAKASDFPKAYVSNRSLFDTYLQPDSYGGTTQVPAAQPSPAQIDPAQVIAAAKQGGASLITPTPAAVDFGADGGSIVMGQTKGTLSAATILAVGVGVAIIGGVVYYAVKKKGRGRR
jgi:hypothetical protein